MSRPTRIEYEGALYHTMSRGVGRALVFLDDTDRREFLELLAALVDDGGLVVHAFCLMPTHYHLLCETPRGDLGRQMRELDGRYAQAFNRRHRRVGHLWQARYKAILVQEGKYFLECSRYIHLNPNRSRLTRPAERYRWSSYRNYVGGPTCVDWVVTSHVLDEFKGDRHRYKVWVEAGRDEKPIGPFERAVAGLALGSEEFTRRLVRLVKEPNRSREEPSAKGLRRHHALGRDPKEIEAAVEEVFRAESRRRRSRLLLYSLRRYSLMNVKEIAERQGKGSSAVSMAVSVIQRESKTNRELVTGLKRLDRCLGAPTEQ